VSDSEHKLLLPLVGKNEESHRLPFVINVVARYWGIEIPISHHEPVGPQGPSIINGIELSEAYGLSAIVYRGSMRDLKRRVDQNIPPIVILPGVSSSLQHATIILGYSPLERRILLYVPEPDTVGAVPETKFEEEWRQEDMTTIAIVPSDMTSLVDVEEGASKVSNRLYLESERLWRENKTSDAVEKLRKAVKEDPLNAQAWAMLGSIHNEIGASEALSYYEQAVRVNPMYYLAHRGLGNYYLKKKEYSKAIASYTTALQLNPRRSPALFKNRALAWIPLDEKDKAKLDLQRYIESAPHAADAESIRQAILEL
jgi:tetratricopeptide (TPR) repeat protein